MRVIAFDREPRHIADFLALPWRLYQGDERWIPPFSEDVVQHISGEHPLNFLEQKNFLAEHEGQIVGRATAFVNPKVEIDGGPLGTLGHFECENDPEAAGAIAEAAFDWLRSFGVRTVWGPMNGSMWFPYRFMTAGFEDAPFYGEPYNKPYYPDLFEHLGFTVLKRWQSSFSDGEDLAGMVEKARPKYERTLSAGYCFRALDMRRFEEEMERLHGLISDSFAGFLGYHPIDSETFLSMFGGLKAIVVPELVQFALNPDGEVVGYICSLPDYPAVRVMQGKTDLWAKLKFLAARGRPAAHITLYLGTKSDRKTRASGLGGALAHLVTRAAHQAGVPLVSALMAEDSYARAYSSGLHSRTHEYALYRREL